MTRKLITSADQLVDGKQYALVQRKFTIKVTFSEVVHPEPQPGYWTTDDIACAQFIGRKGIGCIVGEDRQRLFDGLTEIGVKIYEL
ncbi:hypothetical protein AAA414_05695 [Lactobacillus crispatus]